MYKEYLLPVVMQVLLIDECDRNEDTKFMYIHITMYKEYLQAVVMQVLLISDEDTRCTYTTMSVSTYL